MKREIPYNITIKRISTSPYYSSTFFAEEKNKIESLERITYLPSESTVCADILITNTHTKTESISKEQLDKCILMIHPNSGYDNFSAEFVKSAQFPIISGNEIRAHAVANYILTGLMSHFTMVPIHKSWDKDRKWDRKLLNEINVQLIGFGHIGKILSQALLPLVQDLQIYDPEQGHRNLNLKEADVIILACSLNPTSKSLINEKVLSSLKPNCFIINAARGEILEFESLVQKLKTSPHLYALIDVFPKEPMPIELYESLSNLKMTSHIAGVYSQIEQVSIDFEYKVLKDFIYTSEERFLQKYFNSNLKNKIRNDYLI